MLRMSFDEGPGGMTVRLEGRFAREFAEHARMLIGQSQAPTKVVVDLSDVTFVDATGEEVLIWLGQIGVTFTADSAYCRDICQRLRLRMPRPPSAAQRALYATPCSESHSRRAMPKRHATLSSFSFGEDSEVLID